MKAFMKTTPGHGLLSLLGLLAALAGGALIPAKAQAQDSWPGLRGLLGQRASATPLDPSTARLLWQRTFACSPSGPWDSADQPNPRGAFLQLPVGRGAFNLAWAGGRIALASADTTQPPNSYALTVLDAAGGGTLHSATLPAGLGNRRVFQHPHASVGMACDTTPGLLPIWWDPESLALFTAQSGYDTGYTAVLPLAGPAFQKDAPLPAAIPAFRQQMAEHPELADAFGFTRQSHIARLGVDAPDPALLPWAWGPSLLRLAEGDTRQRTDLGYSRANGFDSLYFYNGSGQLFGDAAGPLLGTGHGYGSGHNPAGYAYLFNKWSGFKVLAKNPSFPPLPPSPGSKTPAELAPFASGGAILHNGAAYLAGPGEDRNADGRFGESRITPQLRGADQGLHLWALDFTLENKQPDGGASGGAALDTATPRLRFLHRFPTQTPHLDGQPESHAPSYYEGDGLYRPKAFLVDGGEIWFAWKPGWNLPIELIRAGAGGAQVWALGVAAARPVIELWPKLALARDGTAKRLVYFTGHGRRRSPYTPDAATAERILAMRHANLGKPSERWSDLPQEEREKRIQNATQGMWWSEELSPPSGPAELAVFDPAGGTLAWTDDLSARAPSLPAYDFFTCIDESHLVATGKWAYVGWIDTTGADATLRLLAYDTTAPAPDPRPLAFPLGIPAREFPRTVLSDLIAADGRLHALIHQSKTFQHQDPRWQHQHVVTLGAAEPGS